LFTAKCADFTNASTNTLPIGQLRGYTVKTNRPFPRPVVSQEKIMSIFSKIKDAIFGKKAVAATTPSPSAIPLEPTAAAPVAMTDVDVIAHLEDMGAGKNLNWRTSIVDLMKLVGMDSSLQERKDLAMELGYTGDLERSAEMNIWLHKAVMRELAANGGKVPAELTD
jgi:hypothetical protein